MTRSCLTRGTQDYNGVRLLPLSCPPSLPPSPPPSGCPLGVAPSKLADNSNCVNCLQCATDNCPYDNVGYVG
jgi:hypothetical protein